MTDPTLSMIETLPYDILETIIEEVAKDSGYKRINKETLSACSLTCRAFVHPCRTHLFSTIDFSQYRAGWKNHSPQLVLQNTSLAAHCRTLVFELGTPHETDDIAEALLQLKKICCFRFIDKSQRGWKAVSPRMQQALIHLFGLPSLTMVKLSLDGKARLPAILLSSCRNLVDLKIGDLDIASTSAGSLTELGPPPRLLSLSLLTSAHAMQSLLDINCSETVPIIDISHLKRLRVGSVRTEDDYKTLENILLLVRKLEWFYCRASSPATYRNLARMLDLKSLATLRSMHLCFYVSNEMQDPFFGLIEELEEMSYQKNTGLQELFLDVTVSVYAKFRLIDREWKKFDNVLGNPSTFPCLQSLTFKITLNQMRFAQCEERLKKFEDMKTRHLTRLSSRENREFRFEFLVEIDGDHC
ncbi:hypothetical protein B0H34DRAFT_847848 [Crassisporium funariophilum]|nr:hypothetical protein B0H34DRAFT_847848 [Crassisporium funariophilum]